MLRNKENPLVGPDGPIFKPELLTWLTLMAHNLFNNGQIYTKPVDLVKIGAGLVQTWSLLTKLRAIIVNHVNNPGWTIGPVGPTSRFSLFLSILIS